jgi:hypothetical protein
MNYITFLSFFTWRGIGIDVGVGFSEGDFSDEKEYFN